MAFLHRNSYISASILHIGHENLLQMNTTTILVLLRTTIRCVPLCGDVLTLTLCTTSYAHPQPPLFDHHIDGSLRTPFDLCTLLVCLHQQSSSVFVSVWDSLFVCMNVVLLLCTTSSLHLHSFAPYLSSIGHRLLPCIPSGLASLPGLSGQHRHLQ